MNMMMMTCSLVHCDMF